MGRGFRVSLAALAALLVSQPAIAAEPVPPGADWHQAYFRSADGTRLHADVLRPAGLPADAKTPVILSVGPYFNHSGQTGALGPIQGTEYEPVGDGLPSSRFYDFVEGADLMERGYTYVMVDLRGFGGSEGCLDWVGPGEQADVKAAAEWAASRPWSTGEVGMYGKSYDAVTGLVGVALEPEGLDAVVAQEPVYDMYRYLYSNGVRYTNFVGTPLLYGLIAGTPGQVGGDSADYLVNSVNDLQRPGCPVLNIADQLEVRHDAPYWRERDLIRKTKGSTVPLFLTQGFLEANTKPDGAFELFNGLAGPKRAWLGMWGHVRGNDRDESGRLLMGRAGWFDEVMRFYDRYLKGEGPAVEDPPIAVETSDGSWRAETRWPPADVEVAAARLRGGSYTDTGLNFGTANGGLSGEGIWTFSPPFEHRVHVAGVPRVTVRARALLPIANLVGDVYDVDERNRATLIHRGTSLVGDDGTVAFDLLGNDWVLPPGHRLGVLITSSNFEWWRHVPTLLPVRVSGGTIELPFLSCRRTETIQGDPSVALEQHLEEAPFEVPAGKVAGATMEDFPVPEPLASC